MNFVLVHGAFQGGWCWKRLRRLLRNAGHEVFTPTLTGLGERSHLLSRDTGLENHIRDIVDFLAVEDLRNVVLVGHSYGGMVVTGACEAASERIRHLVYLDALAPNDGQSTFDLLDKPIADLFRELAADGWRVEIPPDMLLSYLGIEDPLDRRWMGQRFRPQSLRTFEQPFRAITGAIERTPRTYIQSTKPSSGAAYDQAAARAKAEQWAYHSIATAHESMWTMPDEVAAILLRLVQEEDSEFATNQLS